MVEHQGAVMKKTKGQFSDGDGLRTHRSETHLFQDEEEENLTAFLPELKAGGCSEGRARSPLIIDLQE